MLWEDSSLGSGQKPVIANGLSQGLAQKFVPGLRTIARNQASKAFPISLNILGVWGLALTPVGMQ